MVFRLLILIGISFFSLYAKSAHLEKGTTNTKFTYAYAWSDSEYDYQEKLIKLQSKFGAKTVRLSLAHGIYKDITIGLSVPIKYYSYQAPDSQKSTQYGLGDSDVHVSYRLFCMLEPADCIYLIGRWVMQTGRQQAGIVGPDPVISLGRGYTEFHFKGLITSKFGFVGLNASVEYKYRQRDFISYKPRNEASAFLTYFNPGDSVLAQLESDLEVLSLKSSQIFLKLGSSFEWLSDSHFSPGEFIETMSLSEDKQYYSNGWQLTSYLGLAFQNDLGLSVALEYYFPWLGKNTLALFPYSHNQNRLEVNVGYKF